MKFNFRERLVRSAQSRHDRRRRTGHRLSRRTLWILALLVLVVAGFRLALPFVIKSYVNRQLRRIPDYGGHVGAVSVSLWRGGYHIHDITIVKTNGAVPVPFFTLRNMDLSLDWGELFHGAMVGEVTLDAPELNFVSGPTPGEQQTGENHSWGKTLERLFPFKINRLDINDGYIHFRNFHSTPPVDIALQRLTATATNLTNSREVSAKLPAGIHARGTTVGGGRLDLELHVNPLKNLPTFELTAQVTNVDLPALNDFLKAYGKFDVARGKFAAFSSFAATDGHYDGYVKVFFHNLDVFEWKKERGKNILEVFWEAIVGAVSTVFRNQPKDQLATKIPIAGDFEKEDIGIWSASVTLLRNAFGRALIPKLDQQVTVKQVSQEAGAK